MADFHIKRVVRNKFAGLLERQNGYVGVVGNSQGVIHVPGKSNMVYVRVGGQDLEVYNVRVPVSYGLMVKIGTDPSDPKRQQILSILTNQSESNGVKVPSAGYAPASHYQWAGEDPVFIDQRQLLPLRISGAGGLNVSIQASRVKLPSGWVVIPFELFNLAYLVPSTIGKALLALVTIDTTGDVIFTTGSEVDISALTDFNTAPDSPADTVYELALIRLFYGQTLIHDSEVNPDLFDMRMSFMMRLSPSLVGLGNVTNDAQVKAEANSFNGFTEKVAPVADDRLLLEDSEDSFVKKFVEIGNLPGGGEGTLAVSDGTTSINNVATLDIVGGVVSGAAGEATVTISQTSIGLGNITNDAQLKRSGNDWSSFDELTSLADDDKLLAEDYSDGGAKKYIKKSNLPTGGGTAALYACVADVKASGTHGGTFTSGSLQTRTLNTILQDANGIVSLASNRFTLQAGNYAIHATVPAIRVNQHNAVLYNVTNSEITILGNSASSTNTSSVGGISSSIIIGEFTIVVETIFEIRHQCTTSVSTFGYGLGHDFGRNNIYTIVEIWKK